LIYDFELEKMLRDPEFSEAIDNKDLGSLYEWMATILREQGVNYKKNNSKYNTRS
jgi:hypothetical protein